MRAIGKSKPAAPVKPAGLGISRSELQTRFESSGVDFTFENQPLADGRSRMMGTAPNDLAFLELIGEPDELSQVTVTTTVVDEQARMLGAAYFLGVLTLVTPEWDASGWLGESITQLASEEGTLTTIQDGKQIELTFHRSIGLLLLSIEPQG